MIRQEPHRPPHEALTRLGFALGGEAGARAAVGLGMVVSADTLLARIWLHEHPGVAIISRDRGGAYAEGAREGAPTELY
jgi:hypothetical protein